LALLRLLLLRLQSGSSGRLEDFTDAIFGLGGALQVRKCIDLVSHCTAFLDTHGFLFHLHQLALCALVVAQVTLVTDQDYRYIRTEVLHLRCPLLRDVFQAVGTVN